MQLWPQVYQLAQFVLNIGFALTKRSKWAGIVTTCRAHGRKRVIGERWAGIVMTCRAHGRNGVIGERWAGVPRGYRTQGAVSCKMTVLKRRAVLHKKNKLTGYVVKLCVQNVLTITMYFCYFMLFIFVVYATTKIFLQQKFPDLRRSNKPTTFACGLKK